MDFQEQVVLVTGGSKGIGRAISRAFGRLGAEVVINFGHDEEAARQAEREVLDAGGKALACKADITLKEDVDRMFKEILDRFGRGRRKKILIKPKSKTLRKQCDLLWSKLTKEIHKAKHGERCLWCLKKTNLLQSDHVFNRWKTPTRWDLENCVVLCRTCHIFIKKRDPWAWARLVSEHIPAETLDALARKSQEIINPDYEAILHGLIVFDQDKPWLIPTR